MNETITKFGYPQTLIAEYDHWVVLLRPAQVTLGSLILACKSDATEIHKIPQPAFTELKNVTSDIEKNLRGLFDYDKINYLGLMMVDKEVHFHVIPRYKASIRWNDKDYTDTFWPKPVDVLHKMAIDEGAMELLKKDLKDTW